ncbi:alpha/beta hydrolase [Spongiibacter sp. KMU-158]|uniref:Alpha/beta hydrolase n=1 Tax=Spongiibacter pelagi TaxID=2760804 RepID=A0A927GX88_9GAMM|nr:alpha/beta hydrolase [Spongiibacter pelagi]MBD2860270.1 alpha/beta hydrolase [Spongiibacter pelagi]
MEKHFSFTNNDGQSIFVYRWTPETPIKAVLQLEHGASEHAGRYERLAHYLNQHGIAVYAGDHRGHGKSAGELSQAGVAGPDSWKGILADMYQLTGIVKIENPGIPAFLFGHSMGSFLSQNYIQNWGNGLAGAILCGSTGNPIIDPEVLPAAEEAAANAVNEPSDLFVALFEGMNQPFEPSTTPFDWLSRDTQEVQKYLDDPWCGFLFSNALTRDLMVAMTELAAPEREAQIPKNLPVLCIAGDADPVGAENGVQALADRYSLTLGLKDVSCKLYPGARHEILNETNRDEVQEDLLKWIESRI